MPLKKYFRQGSILKDITLVAGGSAIAQGFTMLTMPVLSRIYSPDDFGILSIFISVVSILIPLSSLRYYLAIALPKTDRQANALIILASIIQITNLLILALLFTFLGDSILTLCTLQRLIPYKFLIPLAVLGAGIYDMLVQYAIRKNLFKVIAKTKISQSLSAGMTKIGFGLLGLRPLGLLIGTVIGQTGGITSVALSLYSQTGIPRVIKTDVKRVLLKYRNFPLFDTPSAVINTLGDQIIPLLIFSFYGTQATGFFSISQQLLVIPSVFIGNAVGQVFLQRASVAKYQGNLNSLTLKTYQLLLELGAFPTVIIALLAPQIFSVVLGAEWEEAGLYARCLIPLAMLSFAFAPISHSFNIQSKQKLALKLEVAYLSTKILFFLIGTLFFDPLISIALFAASGGVLVFLRTYFALRITHNTFYEISHILKYPLLFILIVSTTLPTVLYMNINVLFILLIVLIFCYIYLKRLVVLFKMYIVFFH